MVLYVGVGHLICSIYRGRGCMHARKHWLRGIENIRFRYDKLYIVVIGCLLAYVHMIANICMILDVDIKK